MLHTHTQAGRSPALHISQPFHFDAAGVYASVNYCQRLSVHKCQKCDKPALGLPFLPFYLISDLLFDAKPNEQSDTLVQKFSVLKHLPGPLSQAAKHQICELPLRGMLCTSVCVCVHAAIMRK